MSRLVITLALVSLPALLAYGNATAYYDTHCNTYMFGILGLAFTIYSISLFSKSRLNATATILIASFILFIEFLDMASIYKTQNPFNFVFLQFLNLKIFLLATKDDLIMLMIAGLLMLLSMATFFLIYRKPDADATQTSPRMKIALLMIGISSVCLFTNPLRDLIEFAGKAANVLCFRYKYNRIYSEKGMMDAGIHYCKVNYDNLEIEDGGRPNLIFIFLESFENAFANESLFPNLTPNINRMKNEGVSFENINMAPCSNYSFGGFYTSLLGCNQVDLSMFSFWGGGKTQQTTGLLSFPSILHKAGYYQAYASGTPPEGDNIFTLVKDSLYDEIVQPESNEPTYNGIGCCDSNLFSWALGKYEKLAAEKRPFNITMFTADTHDPGHLNENWEVYNNPKVNSLKSSSDNIIAAVHHTDKALGDFIDNLKKSPHWANTVVFITTDHLIRDCSASPILNKATNRNMLVLAVGGNVKHKTINTAGKNYDIAPTVLDLMGIKHNYLFPVGESLLGNPNRIRLNDSSAIREMCLSLYIIERTRKTETAHP